MLVVLVFLRLSRESTWPIRGAAALGDLVRFSQALRMAAARALAIMADWLEMENVTPLS